MLRRARMRPVTALAGLALATAPGAFLAPGAAGEQASQPTEPAAGGLDVGAFHSCATVADHSLRCWGYGGDGRLGYAGAASIGDNESPGSAGPVDLGAGRTVKAISAGNNHSCAVLDDASVRCWGFGPNGRLGYGNTDTIGDNETPGSVGPVALGGPVKAVTAGDGFTCAVLEDGAVRCWGFSGRNTSGIDGRLGYPGRNDDLGDDETPASAGPVDLGPGRTAKAVSSGLRHSCALLDDSTVRCWGDGLNGRLGYASPTSEDVGDDETPGSEPPVALGRPARGITAGTSHTCALLDDGSVRCWGSGANGRLGYANTDSIGDNESPGSAGPVSLGPGRTAVAVSAGDRHTCALLDDRSLRCWGYGAEGQLGYPNTFTVGDNEPPASAGPVNLGPERTAVAVSAGDDHTCARLDDGSVRCWGLGANGRLGYCDQATVGDDEVPGAAGPVRLTSPFCFDAAPPPGDPAGGPASTVDADAAGLMAQAAREQGLRGCLAQAARHTRGESRRARRLPRSRRTRAKLHIEAHGRQLRRHCLKRWGRTPGRVTELRAQASGRRSARLTFRATGTDGSRPPVANTYVVKQSRRPIRGKAGFQRAQSLCQSRCRFTRITVVGGELTLTVGSLRPRTVYHYAIAARDNVSGRLGPRTRSVRVRTR